MTTDWNALAKEIHQVNVEKGWWPEGEERSWRSFRALVASEITGEALEEFRAGRMAVWFDDVLAVSVAQAQSNESMVAAGHKPEGFPVELADGAIRILDRCGAEGVDLEELVAEPPREENIPDQLDEVMEALFTDEEDDMCMVYALSDILGMAEHHGIDLPATIRLKLEFNKTRPERHGGKRA